MAKIKINEIAAAIHMHLVTHSTHGYTQGKNRWGGDKTETIEVKGYKFVIGLNDYDCSSSYITAWIKALEITGYKGVLGTCSQSTKGAISTHNIEQVFVKSGLFTVIDYTDAKMVSSEVGTGLLKADSHVGMYQGDVRSSEFLIAENGKIIPDKVGDNNGRESVVRSARAYGKWKKLVIYNHKADFEPVIPRYELLMDTAVATGCEYNKYRHVEIAKKGTIVKPDKLLVGKDGEHWVHLGNYRWLMVSDAHGDKRAKKIA